MLEAADEPHPHELVKITKTTAGSSQIFMAKKEGKFADASSLAEDGARREHTTKNREPVGWESLCGNAADGEIACGVVDTHGDEAFACGNHGTHVSVHGLVRFVENTVSGVERKPGVGANERDLDTLDWADAVYGA